MTQKSNCIPQKLQVWINVRDQFRLSHVYVQMAQELGMNPKKFGKIANHRQEPWKMPLHQFIEHLYKKRFGKLRPDRVISIEERAKEIERKRLEKKERKLAQAEACPEQGHPSTRLPTPERGDGGQASSG